MKQSKSFSHGKNAYQTEAQFIPSFNPSFDSAKIAVVLLWSRHRSWPRGCNSEQSKVPASVQFIVLWRKSANKSSIRRRQTVKRKQAIGGRGKGADTLDRVVKESLREEVAMSRNLKEEREGASWIP